jgi:hypothetical protein
MKSAMRTLICTFAPLLLLSSSPAAQMEPRQPVAVQVYTREGALVQGLRAEHFRVTQGARQLPLRLAAVQQPQRHIVMLLDISGSMMDAADTVKGPRWQVARQVVGRFLEGAPEGTSFSVLTFGRNLHQPIYAGRDGEELLAALDAIPLEEPQLRREQASTALFDAIQVALESYVLPETTALLLITDGFDNRSRASLRKVERALLERGLPVYAVIFPQLLRLSGAIVPLEVTRLVESSGGTAMHVPAGNTFRIGGPPLRFTDQEAALLFGAVDHLRAMILQPYLLEVDHGCAQQRRWRIRVVDQNGRPRSDLLVNYPQRPPACIRRPGP